jgi:hypothetical protein
MFIEWRGLAQQGNPLQLEILAVDVVKHIISKYNINFPIFIKSLVIY